MYQNENDISLFVLILALIALVTSILLYDPVSTKDAFNTFLNNLPI
jgi:hypothetical protein